MPGGGADSIAPKQGHGGLVPKPSSVAGVPPTSPSTFVADPHPLRHNKRRDEINKLGDNSQKRQMVKAPCHEPRLPIFG